MRFLKFVGYNISYVMWFCLYFTIAWVIFGANLNSFIFVSLVYGVSVGIALSPLGEVILQLMENCRVPYTEEEKEYLLPMFEEVYGEAQELNPKMNKNIKIYIMDAMYVNAFAIGRKTVAVTRGALNSFSRDELKGIIAHELGHITHGHTKALLLSLIGNFFFSIIVWIFRLMLFVTQLISTIVAHFSILGTVFAILTFFIRICLDICVLIFINLSQIILASNSRINEVQADLFAHEIGYGRELISGLYLIQKISINTKVRLSDRMKASHPHTAYRISYLEQLENKAIEA